MRRPGIILGLTLLLLLLAATGLAKTMYVDTPSGDFVNMRDLDKEIIGKVPNRAAVNVISLVEKNYWAYVEYNGQRGLVYYSYLSGSRPGRAAATPTPTNTSGKNNGKSSGKTSGKTGKKTAAPSPTPTKEPDDYGFSAFKRKEYEATVVPATPTGYVNLRWAPSKNAAIQSIRHNGDILQVIAENEKWAQVYDAGQGVSGYMLKKFLKRIDDLPAAATVETIAVAEKNGSDFEEDSDFTDE